MTVNNPYQQYAQNKVFTATPGELTLMLYDGILKFGRRAKLFLEQNKPMEANAALIRAQDIIRELKYALDKQYELSDQLEKLYDFMLQHLIDANIRKDSKYIDEVLDLAQELHDTWKEAIKLERQQRKQA